MPNMRVTHMLYTDVAAPPTPAFIFEAVTTGATENFALPLEASGTYNFNVDWGDTNSDTITTWDQAEVTHNYAIAGTYIVTITGVITGWRFNFNAYRKKIYDIIEWGPLRLGNNNGYFDGCNNLTVSATDNLDLTGTTTMRDAFAYCWSLTTVPSMNSWNMSNITDMYSMFFYASLFNQDISSWDTSSVTDMYLMFYHNTVFNQNIGGWDTSSVQLMQQMFTEAIAFNQDIGSWDVSSVISFANTFTKATSFNQDISSWVTTSLGNMTYMFSEATSFNQDIGGWDVSNVTNMAGMFYGAIVFNQDISGWNVSNVDDMNTMFEGATLFNQDISGWTTSSIANMSNMFEDAIAFEQNIGSWDITGLTGADDMFAGVTLSTANYNALLVGWEAQVEKPNVTFSGGNSTYNAGAPATAKAALQTNGWIITDGGQV